jgi:hypothetical protein
MRVLAACAAFVAIPAAWGQAGAYPIGQFA